MWRNRKDMMALAKKREETDNSIVSIKSLIEFWSLCGSYMRECMFGSFSHSEYFHSQILLKRHYQKGTPERKGATFEMFIRSILHLSAIDFDSLIFFLPMCISISYKSRAEFYTVTGTSLVSYVVYEYIAVWSYHGETFGIM